MQEKAKQTVVFKFSPEMSWRAPPPTQANIIARFIERIVVDWFDNFQSGKNAKSSLMKGEVCMCV